ncbi:pirin family protein [Neptunomonas phycophila]|uniref:Pirin family protein n=1 Tax=Neptunomonas phycophila TaxID=1572645 RepID=A0ABT9EQK4_9GAMM|nr:pirin family protein [Neptunomonas phycophila]MDP2521221.1 pirin family protein [Neptunomonas phycophila]
MNSATIQSLPCTIARLIPAIDAQDGAGVKLKRSLGRGGNTRVDPFLMLDAFSSANPNDYIAGFPAHPHRGFETVTYMLEGHLIHRDHMGNEGNLKSGGVQWMTAGRGVIHEERPKLTNGVMRGFQLWVNLPADEKMKPAFYQDIPAEQVPSISLPNGITVKAIAGSINVEGLSLQGPISGITTEPVFIDVTLPSNTHINLPITTDHQAFIYQFEGESCINDTPVEPHNAAVLTQGNTVTVVSGDKKSRFLLLSGKPINEPIAQYGPFVMNTMAEVEQAIQDYQNGTLTD